MRKIAITNNKGGVLKTSLTVNLAGVIAQKNKKVLIVDTDNQGNVCLSFGINPDKVEHTIYDVLVYDFDVEKAILKEVHKNIDILPANDDMQFFEFDVLTNMKYYPQPFYLLRNHIKKIEHEYDYILFDTPPNLGLTHGNVLTAVDEIIIPFQPELYSMRSLTKILNSMQSFKEDHNPHMKVCGVVATLVDSRTVLHSEVLEECRKFCYENGIKMFETVIPRTIKHANSVAYEKLPATLTKSTKSDRKLVQAYIDLWGEIQNE